VLPVVDAQTVIDADHVHQLLKIAAREPIVRLAPTNSAGYMMN
jgi:hypothetical protein